MSQDTSSWFSGFWERCSNSVVGGIISPSVAKPSDDDTIINRSIYVPESDTSRNDGGEVSNGSREEETGIEKLLDNEKTKQKWLDTFGYIVESEKTKSATKGFCKNYERKEDWTENHCLRNEVEKDGNFGVILDSYQFSKLYAPCANPETVISKESPIHLLTVQEEDRPYYLHIEGSASTLRPTLTDAVKAYLENFRNRNLDFLPAECNSFEGFLEWLEQDKNFAKFVSAAERDKDQKAVHAHIKSSLSYRLVIKFKEVYKKLLVFESKFASTEAEMVFGFGHLRMRYKIKDTMKIVNGPLYEVVVEVHRNEDDSIIISPQQDTKVRVNRDIVATLTASGGANKKFLQEVYDAANSVDPKSICFGDIQTYTKLLQVGRKLHSSGKVGSMELEMVHAIPDDEEGLVINAAWCLYSRKRLMTVHSRAAMDIISCIKSGQLKLTEGMYALMEGSSALKSKVGGVQEDQLVYPLPTSQKQREIGVRLLVENRPVVLGNGPPGTGKTHSIINIIAAALTLGNTLLIASKNRRALTPLVDKIPEEFLPFCLDMSCLDDKEGMLKLHKSLERLEEGIADTLSRQQGKHEIVDELKQQLREKKAQLLNLDARAEKLADFLCELSNNPVASKLLKTASALTARFPWIVQAAVSPKSFDAIKNPQSFLISREQSFQNTCVDNLDEIPAELVVEVSKKAGEEPPTPDVKMETDELVLRSVSEPVVKESAGFILSRIQLDGMPPSTPDEWRRVQHDLDVRKQQIEFMKEYVKPLLAMGYQQSDVLCVEVDKEAYFEALKKGKHIEDLKKDLEDKHRDRLESVFVATSSASGVDLQAQRRELTNNIQEFEAKLVFNKVLLSQSKALTEKNLGSLANLIQATRDGLGSLGSKSEKALEKADSFKKAFESAAKFMPFIVMTTEQVSDLLSPTQAFDIGIVDEASQADCTALIVMAHCKQLCVVGDDKQNSPSQVGLSVERIKFLKTILPSKMPVKEQLLPSKSFFDLMKRGFPTSKTFFAEHFRSVPGIISCSNQLFYDDKLEPLRLPTKDSPVFHKRVQGTRGEGQTNEVECKYIVQQILEHIDSASKGNAKPQTIGVISMGGKEQKVRIEKALADDHDTWSLKYANLKQHRIRVGEPSEFQGDERDIVFLSGVHHGVNVYNAKKRCDKPKKIQVESDQTENRKRWNVALTRAKNKMVLVHSFDMEHTKEDDVRRHVLNFFLKSELKSQVLQRRPTISKSSGKLYFAKQLSTLQVVRDELIGSFEQRGFIVSLKEEGHWSDALCIGCEGIEVCALVIIENAGESKRIWQERIDEQLSLERAGRNCLRVDFITLVLRYESTLQDVLRFLKQIGLEESTRRNVAGSNDDPMDLDCDEKPAQDETTDSTKTTETESKASEESSQASSAAAAATKKSGKVPPSSPSSTKRKQRQTAASKKNASEESSQPSTATGSAAAATKKSGKVPSSSSSAPSNKRKQKQTATSKKTTTTRKSSSSSKKKQRV